MGMDPSGNIRPLKPGEQPRDDEVLLDEAEAARLKRLPKARRHAELASMRKMTTREKREAQRQRAREW